MTEFKPADINAAPMCILIKNQILGKKKYEKSSGLKHISPEIQPESHDFSNFNSLYEKKNYEC